MLDLKNYSLVKNVHVYQQGDLNIAYDVNSGSLHILDEVSFKVLKTMCHLDKQSVFPSLENIENEIKSVGLNEEIAGKDIEEILEELSNLQTEGTLCSIESPEVPPVYPETPIIKAICLHVAHDCNLRCEYCFAETGAFGGNRGLMSFETGKRAIDFVLAASKHRKHCEVDFFGGEPLLNYPVLKQLVAYGREAASLKNKTIKFTLTTNAVLLNDEIQKFLEEEDISVVLSLDGRKEVHNKMRPFGGGQGSYEQVVSRINQFLEQRPNSSPHATGTYYYVRGTFTHFNPDFDKDVLHMLDLGMNYISLEPVVASSKEDYAFKEEDIEKIFAAYDRLAEEIIERKKQNGEINFFHFNVALDQGPCLPKRLSGCGAGHEYVAISPEGDIFPCHQFVGQSQYKMGSLSEGIDNQPLSLNNNLVKTFRESHIYNKEDCRNCWARFMCSGGCHAANSLFNEKLTDVYKLGCDLQKKRLEVALYVKLKEVLNTSSEHKF